MPAAALPDRIVRISRAHAQGPVRAGAAGGTDPRTIRVREGSFRAASAAGPEASLFGDTRDDLRKSPSVLNALEWLEPPGARL